jgi:hypothetical protein
MADRPPFRLTVYRVLAIEALSVLALWWVGRLFGG